MSVKVSSWVWHGEECAELMGNELVLMLALADVAGDEGRCRFMDDGSDLTYATLARKVRVDRRTIIRIVAKLRELGLLVQVRGTNGNPNEFTIVVPWATGDNLSPVISVTGDTGVTSTGDKSRTRTSLKRIDVLNPQSSFAEFYLMYPRKVGKEAARKAFEKATKETDPAVIVAGARRYAADPNLPEKQFIPYPATWLSRGSWDDEPEVERARVIHAPSMDDFAPGDEWMAFNR